MAYSKKRAKKAPRKRKTVTNDETCLHHHCQQWLEKSGIWTTLLIFHVANERKGGIGAIMHFKRLGVRSGVADYLAFAPNQGTARGIAIELKDDEGDQDADQKRFERQWTKAGNTYVIVRTLSEFQNIVRAFVLFGC